MSSLLCASPRCRPPGRHTGECQTRDEPCRGCLPAQAADGLRLCWHCTNHIGPDAIEAARLRNELALCLAASGDGDTRGVNPQPGINLNIPVAEHRATIRHTLVSWTLLVAEERGIGLPWRWELAPLPAGVQGPLNRIRTTDQTTKALGAFLASHAQWLAAQKFAGDAADELAELVVRGRSLRQPSGTRVVQIGPCPHKTDDEHGQQRQCDGTLRALLRQQASLLPSAVTCDSDETHSWDSTQWMKLGRTMSRSAA